MITNIDQAKMSKYQYKIRIKGHVRCTYMWKNLLYSIFCSNNIGIVDRIKAEKTREIKNNFKQNNN